MSVVTLRTFSLAFLVTKEHESSCAVPPMNLRMTHVTWGDAGEIWGRYGEI